MAFSASSRFALTMRSKRWISAHHTQISFCLPVLPARHPAEMDRSQVWVGVAGQPEQIWALVDCYFVRSKVVKSVSIIN